MRSFLLAAALVTAAFPALTAERLAGPYAAQTLRVIDGDTIDARVPIWLGLELTVLVRLRGIDAPELHGPCPAQAQAAKDALVTLVGAGPITLTDIAHDKYASRVDARITLPDGQDVAATLLAMGLARPLEPGGRKPEAPACMTR